jgi:magnesium chelatase family protein
MVGPPGSGKSMMAARMPGLLPPLSPAEALDTSMIHSLAGVLEAGGISRQRPFRSPHHTASMAAMVGGGKGAQPGEISLAHNGVLFMDEFPEFPRTVLETLRQPIETGDVVVSRANAHVRYPARFMLLAAANPCKCGYMGDAARACGRAPQCGEEYLGRISGPLLDRFDLRIEVPAVAVADLSAAPTGETSATVAARVSAAREIQAARYAGLEGISTNVAIEGDVLEQACTLSPEAADMLMGAVDKFRLSARAFHRIQRVGRTIADLRGEADISKPAIAEAIGYRLAF